jgi:hypothetical protein
MAKKKKKAAKRKPMRAPKKPAANPNLGEFDIEQLRGGPMLRNELTPDQLAKARDIFKRFDHWYANLRATGT